MRYFKNKINKQYIQIGTHTPTILAECEKSSDWVEITQAEYELATKVEITPLQPSYEALAASKINAKYTPDEENAILRKTLMALYSELGGEPSPEFKKYYSDAEACKAEARAELAKK